MTDFAIVGAGVAGLTCARALTEAGASVVLYDKGRKAGGRLSTRRAEQGAFDHGAPLFTVGSDDLADAVRRWASAGVVERWTGRMVRHGADERRSWDVEAWVGVPTMSALPRALAEGLDVRSSVRVGETLRDPDEEVWTLRDLDGDTLGTYGTVIVNTPSGQAAALLHGELQMAAKAANAHMDPCWTAMVVPGQPWDPGYDAAEFESGPLSRAISQASKPGRDDTPGWVLQAAADWTRTHWDDRPEAVVRALVEAAGMPEELVYGTAHRWRYARSTAGVPGDCLWSPELRMGGCGDWCGGPGLEGAWRSGRAMAAAILG